MLTQLLKKSSKSTQNKVALSYYNHHYTYQQLDILATQVAKLLISYGIDKGDRVALFMHNCPEMVISYFAIFNIGAIAVPINYRFKTPEVNYVLKHCAVKLLIVAKELATVLKPLPQETLAFCKIMLIATDEDNNVKQNLMICDDKNLPTSLLNYRINHKDLACILYTSGTTAKPKGVMHSHFSLFHTSLNQSNTLQLKQNDKILLSLPICHMAGFAGQMLTTFYANGQIVLIKQFDPEIVLSFINQHLATHLMLLPAQLQQLISHKLAKKTDFSSLKCCVVGGDSLAVKVHENFYQLTGKNVSECCGMTESLSYAMNPVYGKKRIGSIGIAAHATQLAIIDDHKNFLPANQMGEIIVKSDANMIGYWHNNEATKAVLANGWIHTGDLAYQDDDGYYWFMGRKKEIIIRGGSNIAPLEVENILYQHPAVKEVGVVGYPDKKLGQVVYALVVLQANKKATEIELQQFVQKYLADYKVPEKIIFIDSLPYNAVGKLDHKQLLQKVIANFPGK